MAPVPGRLQGLLGFVRCRRAGIVLWLSMRCQPPSRIRMYLLILPIAAKQEVLRIVRGALTGQTGEVDDPVIASVLSNGPNAFPKDFLDGDIGSKFRGHHTYLPTLPAGMPMGAAERHLQRHPDHRGAVRGALPRGVARQHRAHPGGGVR